MSRTFGGHKWAPNTIVYPSGDWHGRLSERDSVDAQQILFDALGNGGFAAGVRERKVADPIMIDRWRGRMGLNQQEQLQVYKQVLEKQNKQKTVLGSPTQPQQPQQQQTLFSAPGEELYEDDGLKEQKTTASENTNKSVSQQNASAANSIDEDAPRVKVIFETFQKVRTEIDAKAGERILDIVKDNHPSRHGVYQALECTCGGQLGRSFVFSFFYTRSRDIFEITIVLTIDFLFACVYLTECATCHVYIESPYHARLPPVSDAEEDMLEYAVGRKESSRLGCQIKIHSEMEGMIIKLPQY